ncbi:MAG: acylphosphatase [Saprospiraceae bacterium]
MIKTISIQVYGKVQGVWYRASTQDHAQSLGIVGTVQNRKDGSVYIEAQGTTTQLNALINWCKEGPELARVDRIEQATITPKAYPNFSVVR